MTRREWIGVGLTALGLAFLAATLGETGNEKHSDYDGPHPPALRRRRSRSPRCRSCSPPPGRGPGATPGTLLAAAAGLQWGASDVTIKAASGGLADDGLLVLFTPLALDDPRALAHRPRRERPLAAARRGGRR